MLPKKEPVRPNFPLKLLTLSFSESLARASSAHSGPSPCSPLGPLRCDPAGGEKAGEKRETVPTSRDGAKQPEKEVVRGAKPRLRCKMKT